MTPSRALALIVVAYAFLAVGMLRWHVSYGPPYYQTTLPLLVLFAVCAALAGVLSVWAALGMLHWTKRASGCIVAASILAGVWLLFFEWNQYLIWQMVVLLAVQMACLVVLLGICRVVGLTARPWGIDGPPSGDGSYAGGNCFSRDPVLQDGAIPRRLSKTSQMSIRDLLVLTAAFALCCAVLRSGRPVELGATGYGILFAGGCCAALAGLTAFWVSFSRSNLILRLAVLALVAPIGGGVHAIASCFGSLLFNWGWCAGVTTLQMLFMMLPFAVVRAYGISFAKNERQTNDICEPYSSATGA